MTTHEHGTAARDLRNGQTIRSLLRSRIVWLGLLVTVLGATLLVHAAMSKPATSSTNGQGVLAGLFTPVGPEAGTLERVSNISAIWMVQLGPCLLAGFAVGWGARRFLPWTILVAAIAALSMCIMGGAGFFEVNYEHMQSTLNQGVDWAKSNAGPARDWIMRSLPMWVVVVMGMFFGTRS